MGRTDGALALANGVMKPQQNRCTALYCAGLPSVHLYHSGGLNLPRVSPGPGPSFGAVVLLNGFSWGMVES